MSTADTEDSGLDQAIAVVYAGPLEAFVQRRDALAKELRAAGRREDASAVKALRKPSRVAWALDRAAREGAAIGPLDAAVAATLEAQAAGGDVRGAIAGLRSAVREFAGSAARAAQEAGHRLEESLLTNAVLAVLGRSDAFDALRRGRLADVPEAGGLDFLANLPVPEVVPRPVRPEPQKRPAGPSPAQQAGIEAAAREAVHQARVALADAAERSKEAGRALREAESRLEGAEKQLRQVEAEVRVLRGERERARKEADTAAAHFHAAEQAVAEAESTLGNAGARATHPS